MGGHWRGSRHGGARESWGRGLGVDRGGRHPTNWTFQCCRLWYCPSWSSISFYRPCWQSWIQQGNVSWLDHTGQDCQASIGEEESGFYWGQCAGNDDEINLILWITQISEMTPFSLSGSPFCPSFWECIGCWWKGEGWLQKEKTCGWSDWEALHTQQGPWFCPDHHPHRGWIDPWDASIWILEGGGVQALQLCCPGNHTPWWSLAPPFKGKKMPHHITYGKDSLSGPGRIPSDFPRDGFHWDANQ